jgi:hypothetical protein
VISDDQYSTLVREGARQSLKPDTAREAQVAGVSGWMRKQREKDDGAICDACGLVMHPCPCGLIIPWDTGLSCPNCGVMEVSDTKEPFTREVDTPSMIGTWWDEEQRAIIQVAVDLSGGYHVTTTWLPLRENAAVEKVVTMIDGLTKISDLPFDTKQW